MKLPQFVRDTLDVLHDYRRWISYGALGALVWIAWDNLPEPYRHNLKPWNWGSQEWASTLLLVLILVSVWAVGGWIGIVASRLDQNWSETDELRSEVGSLREEVHRLRTLLEPKTDPVGFPAVEIRPQTAVMPAVRIEDEPTTVTGHPSARPAVPGASGATRADLDPQEAPRGRHAAREEESDQHDRPRPSPYRRDA